jgi:protein-L-isoaspartate(D-aspartate) O-methyltransferase
MLGGRAQGRIGSRQPALANGESGDDTALARFLLDLRSAGLTEPALFNAFERVPRSVFLPEARTGLLYQPIALPIACGEEAEDPFLIARMLLLARISPGQRILEIGTGSGFSAALMAMVGAEVISLERYARLGLHASRAINTLGLRSVTILQADGLGRRPIGGPFDRLLLGGSLDLVPQQLFEGLVPGGIAIGGRRRQGETRLTLWRIDQAGFPVETDLGPARLAPLRSGLPRAL